ncbi:universal stress protein [Amaricoccus macauensis]|uniref:universal stress protein n=1 Tax=Amaricoccus macauensis TaxID=57001 RepID=UPI003C7DB8F8
MYSTIMIPVDLAHTGQMAKSLSVAAALAKQFGSKAHMVGVTLASPTAIARTPGVFAGKLTAFAAEQSAALGTVFEAHTEISHDPAIDIDDVLMRAAKAIGADLIVMASHVPGFAEHLFASRAGYLAAHAPLSVFVVR